MDEITLRPVTADNFWPALQLGVAPEQQRFVADYAPVVALGLAKAYVGWGGATWAPYAIYVGATGATGATLVGFTMLAYEADTSDQYWVFHYFIDQRYQGRGYGKATLQHFIDLVRREHPTAQMLQLVVNPENTRAQHLYTRAGFHPTGTERWGEPVYQLPLR